MYKTLSGYSVNQQLLEYSDCRLKGKLQRYKRALKIASRVPEGVCQGSLHSDVCVSAGSDESAGNTKVRQ